jgi:hypothetical protein
MITQSWTSGTSMITNVSGNRHTNFIITTNRSISARGGYLSTLRDDSTTLFNYNLGEASGDAQTITYWTKDIDFGLPSQTKKIFKVYLTYRGNVDALDVFYRTDGTTTNRQFNSEDCPLGDVGSTLTLVTLTPTTASAAKDIKSFSLYFNGAASEALEINDISILYRLRPLK